MVNAEVRGVKDLQNALNDKLKDFTKNPKAIYAGIFESAKYDDGTPVAQVAFWQEYGTLKIPMRPFMRNALAKNKVRWIRFFKRQIESHLDFDLALNRTGEIMRGDIIKSIVATTTPPNKPSTIKAKKSSHPLIDTGLLKNSVSYEVRAING